jgi:hypothetical protein
VLATEIFVLIAMVSRFNESPLDAHTVRLLLKSVVIGAVVLLVDRALRPIGPARLIVDGLLYAALAFALRVVRLSQIREAFRLLRSSTVASSPNGRGVR